MGGERGYDGVVVEEVGERDVREESVGVAEIAAGVEG